MTLPRAALLIASIVLAGCYGSSQVKDGQSHWLERCSQASDCGDEQICACGVCTIACDADAACGARGACTELDEIAACSAPASVERACLQRCDEDDECGASGVECIDQRCIATAEAGGAPPEDTVDTIDGPLTCDEVRSIQVAALEALDEAYAGECSSAADCTCVTISTPCAIDCSRPVPTNRLAAYEDGFEAFSADYCADPDIGAICGTSVTMCLPEPECPVSCVAGRCMFSGRSSCSSDGIFAGCEQDQICHIDNTCIDRNTADENGVETLAIGKHMGETGELSPWGSILDMAVTDDAVYWIDVGSSAREDIAPTDAALFRLIFATEDEAMVPAYVTYLAEDLVIDERYAYFYQGGDLRASRLDGESSFGTSIGSERTRGPWALGDTGVVYAAQGGTGLIERFDVADGSPTEVVSFGDDRQVVGLAFYEGTLLVETNVYLDESTTLHRVDLESNESTVLVDTFRELEAASSRIIVHEAMILSNDAAGDLRGHDLASGEMTTYAVAGAALRSASDGYVYYVHWKGTEGEELGRPYTITRTELSSGATVVMLATTDEVGDVVEHDGQLFWVENARLLRTRWQSSLE